MSIEKLKQAVRTYDTYAKDLDKDNLLGSYLDKLARDYRNYFGPKTPKAFYDINAALSGEDYSVTINKSYGNMGLNVALSSSSGIAGYLFEKHVSGEKRKEILRPRNGSLVFNFLNGNVQNGKEMLYEGNYRNFFIKISFSEGFGFGISNNTVYINVTSNGSPLNDLIAYYKYAAKKVTANVKSENPATSASFMGHSDMKKLGNRSIIIANLVKMANHLDFLNLNKEADFLDGIIKEATKLTDQLDVKNLNEDEESDDNAADDMENYGWGQT